MIRRFSVVRAAAIVMALALPFTAFANSVGKAVGGGNSLDFQLGISGHQSIELRVAAPDGEIYTMTFENGKPVSVRLKDLGANPVDGAYTYEMIVSPRISPSVAKKLESARAANDDAAARKILRENGIATDVKQSGTFTVLNGSILNPEAKEATASSVSEAASLRDRESAPTQSSTSRTATPKVGVNAQVIADDLIVQGSECVGLDCSATESFGFDTIRMKENNLRIKAEDTSTSSGFPTTDWQLTFNDSASGGSNKFSVDDVTAVTTPFTLTGGAPSNSIFVASDGKVGFRTSTPGLDLTAQTGNTPALRFDQTNAGGFTAQTWDVAGNEANFFIRDVTSGSRLPFRIRPGAPTSSIDIAASGQVGIGTASPQTNVHVFSASTADAAIGLGNNVNGSSTSESAVTFGYAGATFGRGAGFINTRPDTNAVAPNPSIRILTGNTQRMIVDNEGYIGIGTTTNPDAPIHYTNGATQARLTTAGVWQDSSSRAAKENIAELDADAAMKALQDLKPVRYNYKVLPTDAKVGFIAEDVPEIVATPERQGLSALDIVAVVTKVVQEQQKTIEELNQRIAELEARQQ